MAPGTKVLLLSERENALHLDPVFRGCGPEWRNKPPLINARDETASSGHVYAAVAPQTRQCPLMAGLNGKMKEKGKSHKHSQLLFLLPSADSHTGRTTAKKGL